MSTANVQSQLSVLHGPGMHGPDDPNSVSNSGDDRIGCFTEGGQTAPSLLRDFLTLTANIRRLEKVEKDLARKYGMHICPLEEVEKDLAGKDGMHICHIDSVGVREEANARKKDGTADSISHSQQLHELYHLRIEYRLTKPADPMLTAPSTVPSHRINASGFWAVVIGIDGYPTSPLRGCVSDAIKMETFLCRDLGVPKHRIQCLIDSPQNHEFSNKILPPSRANIMETLYGLINNPHILKDENIIIYFAGHGAFYPSEGGDIETVEALCPIDRGTDRSGAVVHDICDREINTILSQISRAKGHKITVILDCCHSGGATRTLSGGTPRVITGLKSVSLQHMLRVADEDLEAKRFPDYKSIRSEEWLPDMDSHVVLAACKAFQIAIEEAGEAADTMSGYFTTHLLAALKSGNVTDKTTYHTLLDLIPVSARQTPVVAGKNIHALLWYQESGPVEAIESPSYCRVC